METQVLTKRPTLAFVVPQKSELAVFQPPPRPEAWELVVAVSDLIKFPVSAVNVVSAAGRFYLLDYQPWEKSDPTLVLMIDKRGEFFNRIVKDLIAFKSHRAILDPGQWYKQARPFLDLFLDALRQAGALPHEKEMVMTWATGVICQMR